MIVAEKVKSLSAVQETQVQSLGQEDSLEKGITTYSSILALRIQGVERGWALCPPCSALSHPAGMGRPFPLLAFTCWAISSCFQLISAGTPGARPVSCPTLGLGVCSCLGGSFLLPWPWVLTQSGALGTQCTGLSPPPPHSFSLWFSMAWLSFQGLEMGKPFCGDPMDPAQSSSANMEAA